MCPHVGQKSPCVGVLLPIITGHLVKKMTLPMNNFIVTQGQHEVLRIGVPNREGDVVLVELTEPRVQLEIVEHVVHPTHVPFQVESKSAHVSGLGHHRPGGRFFCNRKGTWVVLEQHMIGLLEETNSLSIFATTIFIW